MEKSKNDASEYVVKGIEIKNWDKIQQSSNRVITPATKIILKQFPCNNKVSWHTLKSYGDISVQVAPPDFGMHFLIA